jgi:hypothetical protein
MELRIHPSPKATQDWSEGIKPSTSCTLLMPALPSTAASQQQQQNKEFD